MKLLPVLALLITAIGATAPASPSPAGPGHAPSKRQTCKSVPKGPRIVWPPKAGMQPWTNTRNGMQEVVLGVLTFSYSGPSHGGSGVLAITTTAALPPNLWLCITDGKAGYCYDTADSPYSCVTSLPREAEPFRATGAWILSARPLP